MNLNIALNICRFRTRFFNVGKWIGIIITLGIYLVYVTDPFAFVTLNGSFFWLLRSDTRAMGRVLDVIW